MAHAHCQVCKEILFEGGADPLEVYIHLGSWTVTKPEGGVTVYEGGGWPGPPLAVCLGSWRNLWQRKWYHQKCCGVEIDTDNPAGRWRVFGGTDKRKAAYREIGIPEQYTKEEYLAALQCLGELVRAVKGNAADPRNRLIETLRYFSTTMRAEPWGH
jgi:hypothetical protein